MELFKIWRLFNNIKDTFHLGTKIPWDKSAKTQGEAKLVVNAIISPQPHN